MKVLKYYDYPINVFGVPFFEDTHKLERLPDCLTDKLENLKILGKRCPGARLVFKTDAEKFILKVKYKTLSLDMGMSVCACQSFYVTAGEGENKYLAGIVAPPDYETKEFEGVINKQRKMEDVMIVFPRNEVIEDIRLIFEDDAVIKPLYPYKRLAPIAYYGSSITEGGCFTTPLNAYTQILSERLGVDYYNFGFSASAKGESDIAHYISKIDMSVFVLDYDHNAPDANHLQKTHRPFFEIIRNENHDMPVIIMSKPSVFYTEDDKRRREIIFNTYDNAINSGDKNVYFIDGEKHYGEKEGIICSMDGTHPNDLGMIRIADAVYPILNNVINKLETNNGVGGVKP